MKFRAFLAVLALCLLLTGCSEVEDTEAAIGQIGRVTMDSLAQIEEAERLYNALSPQKQAEVSNSDVLSAARADYETYKAAVVQVCSAIDAIGEVTPESGRDILRARCFYDALELIGFEKQASHMLPVLEEAENQYMQLRFEDGSLLLEKKQYQEAYDLFRSLLVDFPDCPAGETVRLGAADALSGIAQKEFSAGKLEETLYALEDIQREYGLSEGTQALWEKLEAKLEKQRPQNGRTFKNTIGWGQGEFTVCAGDQDACVKLEDISDSSKFILFYVRAGEEATVKVRDGNYIMKYTTGEYWFSQDTMFGKAASFSRSEDLMSYSTTQEGSYTYYGSIYVTLYSVSGGNMETQAIGADSF